MKKNHTILLFIGIIIFAENAINAQMKIGISGGFNLNTISPQIAEVILDPNRTKYFASESKSGFYGQFTSQHNINKYVDLLMLAGFSIRRFEKIDRFDGDAIIQHENKIFTVQQINLGAALLYGLPLGAGKVSIGGGGNISHPISAKFDWKLRFVGPGPSGTNVQHIDTSGQKFAPGALALFRYEFNFGAVFEIRYNYQFRTLPGVNLSIFELGAGYNLQLKRKKSRQ